MLYENLYVWFVFVSFLDLILTWTILYLGGREANPLARHFLDTFGIGGMVAFKLALVVLVIVLCEWVGRHSHSAGKRLVSVGIFITCVPVAVAFTVLFVR